MGYLGLLLVMEMRIGDENDLTPLVEVFEVVTVAHACLEIRPPRSQSADERIQAGVPALI